MNLNRHRIKICIHILCYICNSRIQICILPIFLTSLKCDSANIAPVRLFPGLELMAGRYANDNRIAYILIFDLRKLHGVTYTNNGRISKMERADIRESFADETNRRFRELADFLAKWHDLPAQRSQQWLDDRTFSVGASEIATLLGELTGKKINPYQTIRTLVGTKAGLIKVTDYSAMNWGCVLEKVVTMLAEIIFDCHIEEMGSIPTKGMRNQRSSPDGVAVVPCLGNKIISFEFKAPKNRIPRGSVPACYRPQVLTCLCAVEPSDLGIFIDCVIRRCSKSDWNFESSQYNYEYHREIDLGEPMALGILFFYEEPLKKVHESQEPEKKIADQIDNVTEVLEKLEISGDAKIDAIIDEVACDVATTDLGTCDTETFDDYFSQVARDHTMRVEYSKVFVAAGGQPDWNAEIAKHPKCIGILPIKIMRCVVCPVAKEPDYVQQFQPLVDQIVSTVHTIRDAPEDDRQSVYEQACNALGWYSVPYGH